MGNFEVGGALASGPDGSGLIDEVFLEGLPIFDIDRRAAIA